MAGVLRYNNVIKIRISRISNITRIGQFQAVICSGLEMLKINKLRMTKVDHLYLILEERSPEQSMLCLSAYLWQGFYCCLKLDKFSWVELLSFTKYIIIKKC